MTPRYEKHPFRKLLWSGNPPDGGTVNKKATLLGGSVEGGGLAKHRNNLVIWHPIEFVVGNKQKVTMASEIRLLPEKNASSDTYD